MRAKRASSEFFSHFRILSAYMYRQNSEKTLLGVPPPPSGYASASHHSHDDAMMIA